MLTEVWGNTRWGMRTVLICAALVAVVTIVSLLRDALDSTPAVIGIAAAVGLMTAAALTAIAHWALPRGVVSHKEVRLALAWGALVATCVASALNSFGPGEFIAPFVEELLKAGGVIVVLRCLRGTVTPIRGFAIGLTVGAAFEAYENVLYVLIPDTPPEAGAEAADALHTAVARLLVGFGLHAVTTSLVGAAIGYAICRTGRAFARFSLAALAGAIAIHLVWDVADDLAGAAVPLRIVDYLVIIAVFVYTRRWSLKRSRTWARTESGESR